MPEDNEKVVQNTEQTSTTETVSTEKQETDKEPSPEQKMAELIKEQVTTEVAKATEASKREIQSVKDKGRAEVDAAIRRAHLAEGVTNTARKTLQETDPEAAKEMELAEFRAKEQGRASLEQEEAATKAQADFHTKFHDNLAQAITSLGVDPNDQKIDWAKDAPNYLEAQSRVLGSAIKIQKENQQTIQNGLEKRLHDLEAKVGQVNIEANSVETSTSTGVAVGSDAEFIKKFGSGELPMTKVNVDRHKKIQDSYE